MKKGAQLASRILTRCAILAGVASAVAAWPAAAQIANPTAILDSLDFGGVANRLIFTPSVDVAYDSNVARSNNTVAITRGLTPADEIYSPSLAVDILQPVGRNSVFAAGTLGYNFYDHNSVLNREALSLNGGANLQAGRCRATLSGGYARRQNSLEDETGRQVQDTFDAPSVSLNASCGGDHGFSPVFTVAENWTNNSIPSFQTSNLQTFSASGGLAYKSATLGVASLFGQYSKTDFPNRVLPTATGLVHDSYESEGGGVRYERMLGARIQGTVALSYTHIDTALSTGPAFSGLTYDADLTYRASSRLGFHGSFGRDVLPTNLLNAAFRVQTTELVEANYSAGQRLTFNLGASSRDAQVEGSALALAPPGQDLTEDNDRAIYSSATYALRKISFRVSVRNDRRTTNLSEFNYWDTRADFSVSATF